MNTQPLFSVIHPSARPDKWREIYDAWMNSATHPEYVEYVLCMDERWAFTREEENEAKALGIVTVWNTGRRCYVDAVNSAARLETGAVLIVIADDQYPAEKWDEHLLKVIDKSGSWKRDYSFVIEVSTGTRQEHERGIIVMPILSRERYEQQGSNVFFPEYESMYADNDFAEAARKDGVVIEARHLMFPHRHWGNGQRGTDRVDQAQNRSEAYQTGERIIARRRAEGFRTKAQERKPRLSVCLPGESFSSTWVTYWTAMLQYLLQHFDVNPPVFTFSSIVYHTRQAAVEALLKQEDRPDYVLWIDDDNPLSINQFAKLYSELSSRPDVEAVTAWYFIGVANHEIPATVSAGHLDSENRNSPFSVQEVLDAAGKSEMIPAGYCGFGSVIMRMGAIEAIPKHHFRALIGDQFQWGQSGEDVAFWSRFRDHGMKLLLDPRVKVPHLKLGPKEPKIEYISAKQAAERTLGRDPSTLKICTIVCAKNEARWIARTVGSAKALGPVYVLDDHSTDDTSAQAKRAGAEVVPSPFSGAWRDEPRDKNLILQHAKTSYNPDWVLYLDGDEELPAGAEKTIREACGSGKADSYAFGFVNLWNDANLVRIDGIWGSFQIARLYSAANLEFCAPYENCSIHSIVKDKSPAAINVQILHYGYMLREDRIRKYRYYNEIDPNNEREDCYRHIVQGDLPEVPADAKLKHAGPLDIRLLPAALASRWGPVLQEAAV